MNARRLLLVAPLLALAACRAPGTQSATATGMPHIVDTPRPTARPSPQTATPSSAELSADEAATLASLERVDDYPLYVMHYQGVYSSGLTSLTPGPLRGDTAACGPAWGCSLFAALGDPQSRLYGRNFDWMYSPALLLFTAPPDGYASVSMVDIAYLGWADERAGTLMDQPLSERSSLLRAPVYPFDGMNARGLVVGMAAVPDSPVPNDPGKTTLDDLDLIRELLDHAGTVDEAVALMGRYNVSWGSGPPIHYLIADATGRAVLVEYYEGEMVVLPNENPWHLATNHYRAALAPGEPSGCWRYDRIGARLAETGGRLSMGDALDLLSGVAQPESAYPTQWSVVYGLSTGEVRVVMGSAYEDVHTFQLDMTAK